MHTMDFFTKLAASFYLLKKAEEAHIDNGKPAQVKTWDAVKGVPGPVSNNDYTDTLIPNPQDMPTDIGTNNKQLISGTGTGALICGRYRNGDR